MSITGPDQVIHSAWCSPEGVIQYQHGSEPVEEIAFPACSGAPTLALGADGLPHLVWYATEIRDTTGVTRANSILVESIRLDIRLERTRHHFAYRIPGNPIHDV